MSNFKMQLLEFVAKLCNLEVNIKPRQLKDIKLRNMLVTYEVEHSLYRLLEYFKKNKKIELQMELTTLCQNLELSFDKGNEYRRYRREVFKSDNKKLKLIEILKGIEHGKTDYIYHSYYGEILYCLADCGVIDKCLGETLYDKIGNIILEKGLQEEENDNRT